MYIQIQTIDGQVIQSDMFDLADLGDTPIQQQEALSGVTAVFENWRSAEHVAFEIGQRRRYFNPENILWAEVVD